MEDSTKTYLSISALIIFFFLIGGFLGWSVKSCDYEIHRSSVRTPLGKLKRITVYDNCDKSIVYTQNEVFQVDGIVGGNIGDDLVHINETFKRCEEYEKELCIDYTNCYPLPTED
jgi:hypothetical protein